MTKKRAQTVTITRSRDGSYTFRSTGGYDLRNLFKDKSEEVSAQATPVHPGDEEVVPQ